MLADTSFDTAAPICCGVKLGGAPLISPVAGVSLPLIRKPSRTHGTDRF